jgi:hypothetical protein
MATAGVVIGSDCLIREHVTIHAASKEPGQGPPTTLGDRVFILTSEKYAYASSSLIRQIAAFGGSMDTLTPFVPDRVQLALRAKLDDPSNPLGRLRAEQAQD